LHHLKPHGALYNMAARDPKLARTVSQAVKDFNDDIVFYGLSGSHLISEAKALGLRTASEVFADRTYQDDGSLTPRSRVDALIDDEEQSIRQVLQMLQQSKVTSVSGKTISVDAGTICIHGDGKHAVQFAKRIRKEIASIEFQKGKEHQERKC
jgi:UPF0271 protein